MIKLSWIYIKSKNLPWSRSVLIWLCHMSWNSSLMFFWMVFLTCITDCWSSGAESIARWNWPSIYIYCDRVLTCPLNFTFYSLVSKATFTCVSAFSLEVAWLIAWVSLCKWEIDFILSPSLAWMMTHVPEGGILSQFFIIPSVRESSFLGWFVK